MNQLEYNQDSGRYRLNGYEFHSGDGLEVLIIDEQGRPAWTGTRFEYSSAEWYLVGLPDVSIGGLFARLPEDV